MPASATGLGIMPRDKAFPSTMLSRCPALAFALATSVSLGCSPPPANVCFEIVPLDRPLLCGLDGEQQQALVPEGIPAFASACYAPEACPAACPADGVVDDTIVPDFLDANPNFVVESAQPLCREDDPNTGECCYWVVLEGRFESAQ